MSSLPIIDQILIALASETPPSPTDFSRTLDKPLKQVHTFYWHLRKRGHLDVSNRLTDAGRSYVALIKSDPMTAIRGGRPSKGGQPTEKSMSMVSAPVRLDSANQKAAAVRELGSGLVDNVERSARLLRAIIEDDVEGMSEQMEAAFDQLELAVQLLRTGYRAAA